MNVCMKKAILLEHIQVKKREMYIKAKYYGMTDPRVVTCSQDLDMLLNQYQDIYL